MSRGYDEREGGAGRGETAAEAELDPGKRTRTGSGTGDAKGDGPVPDLKQPEAQKLDSGSPAKVTHETMWDAPDGTGKTRTTVGVGETVFFSADVDGDWSATNAKPGKPKTVKKNQQYDWVAPNTADSVTITFDPGGGAAPTTVVIRVIQPDDVKFDFKDDNSKIPKGTMGATLHTDVSLLPLSVSFAATAWKEIPGPGSKPDGYFKGQKLPDHHPAATPRHIGAKNAGPTDEAEFRGFPKPWDQDGTFEWEIPNNYVADGESGNGHFIKNTHQVCKIEGPPNAGRTTVTKEGPSATRDP
jgi:hypothetical protein